MRKPKTKPKPKPRVVAKPTPEAAAPGADPTPKVLDPLAINQRLYRQVSLLLDDLEDLEKRAELTLRERIAAMVAVGRIQTIFKGLRREAMGEPKDVGSAVRAYSRAFATHAASVGASDGGPAAYHDTYEPADFDDSEDPEPERPDAA